MPIELSMWRIDSGLSRIESTGMGLEDQLEELLSKDITIASDEWLVIGRQVKTPWGKWIDLLCMDLMGNLIILELKRDKTEREIVAQILDYGSWVQNIKSDDIPLLFKDFQEQWHKGQPTKSVEEAFVARFPGKQFPEELNSSHQLVVVAARLDAATERIVKYLAEVYDVNINAVFFQVFKDGDREFLTRAWLRDPAVDEDSTGPAKPAGEKVEWNNEYYVNFESGTSRDWDDAKQFGFVSAGRAPRFRDAMLRLQKDKRIWVNSPGAGYVGVGIVEEAAVPVDKFMVKNDKGENVPILTVPHKATEFAHDVGDNDKVEYVARIRWLKKVDNLNQAIREHGFFGVPNVVAEPRSPKWLYTVDRLKQRFGIS